MRLDFDFDTEELGRAVARAIGGRITGAVDDAIRYGSLGRAMKEAAEHTCTSLVAQTLADPAFRVEAAAALRRGILRGIEARGEKVARGMNVQQALALALVPADGEGTR